MIIRSSAAFQREKRYAFEVLLREILGLEFSLEPAEGAHHTLLLPNGAEWRWSDGFGQNPARLAEQFLQRPDADDFDPFAFSFFMLARTEEMQAGRRDAHGRFPAEQSLAWQKGFLHRPVVNECADGVEKKLRQLGWQGERKKRAFQVSFSCDVDHPLLWWSAADRLKTLAGALFKRGNLREAAYFFQQYVFKKKDPYDVFDEWMDFFERHNCCAQFNFMGERPRNSDCWYPLHHPFVTGLMQKIAERGHRIGFHASYESLDEPAVFECELASLRAVSPLEITAGRQHYLRFSVPHTWKMWEAAGLREDSTLGYPEAEGFRCGICHDYPVFDSTQQKMPVLREKPLIAMDVTLAHYRRYSPEQAADQLIQLRREVEKHGGDFTLLWHNSSWNTAFWEDWKTVFQEFLRS